MCKSTYFFSNKDAIHKIMITFSAQINIIYSNRIMAKNDFVTIADLSRDEILHLIELASLFEKHPNRELLKGKIVATLFYEVTHNNDIGIVRYHKNGVFKGFSFGNT